MARRCPWLSCSLTPSGLTGCRSSPVWSRCVMASSALLTGGSYQMWECKHCFTLALSLMDPLPSTEILAPVSSCRRLIVLPWGPKIFPTKLNWTAKQSWEKLEWRSKQRQIYCWQSKGVITVKGLVAHTAALSRVLTRDSRSEPSGVVKPPATGHYHHISTEPEANASVFTCTVFTATCPMISYCLRWNTGFCQSWDKLIHKPSQGVRSAALPHTNTPTPYRSEQTL